MSYLSVPMVLPQRAWRNTNCKKAVLALDGQRKGADGANRSKVVSVEVQVMKMHCIPFVLSSLR